MVAEIIWLLSLVYPMVSIHFVLCSLIMRHGNQKQVYRDSSPKNENSVIARTKARASVSMAEYFYWCLLSFFENKANGFSKPSSPARSRTAPTPMSQAFTASWNGKWKSEALSSGGLDNTALNLVSTSWYLSDQTHFTVFLKKISQRGSNCRKIGHKLTAEPTHAQKSHPLCAGAWDQEIYHSLNLCHS